MSAEFEGLGTGDLSRMLNETRSKFTFHGKEYTVGELDLEGYARVQSWIVERAHAAIERSTWASDEQKARYHREVFADEAIGKYSPGGEYFAQAIITHDGQVKILFELLRDQIPDLEITDCEKSFQDHFVAQAKLRKRLDELKEQDKSKEQWQTVDATEVVRDVEQKIDKVHFELEMMRMALYRAVPIDPKA